MISNLHLIATLSAYELQRYNEIRLLEGTKQGRPYLDTTEGKERGHSTFLIGSVTL